MGRQAGTRRGKMYTLVGWQGTVAAFVRQCDVYRCAQPTAVRPQFRAAIVILSGFPTPAPNMDFQPKCLGNPHEMVGKPDDNLRSLKTRINASARRSGVPFAATPTPPPAVIPAKAGIQTRGNDC